MLWGINKYIHTYINVMWYEWVGRREVCSLDINYQMIPEKNSGTCAVSYHLHYFIQY